MQQVIYRYDNTLNGLLCCLFRAIRQRETPLMILTEDELQSLLFPQINIETDKDQANLVADTINRKISPAMLDFVFRVQLCSLPGKEMCLLELIRRAFREGEGVLNDMSDRTVSKLRRAVTSLNGEAHLYRGFVRFQESGGMLSAVIEPKNRVLMLIKDHFADRFPDETFFIYDKVHQEGLFHAMGKSRVIPIEDFSQPAADEAEQNYRNLWRGFFRTVMIEQRKNPVCQRSHMPKRYWTQMTEMLSPDNALTGSVKS